MWEKDEWESNCFKKFGTRLQTMGFKTKRFRNPGCSVGFLMSLLRKNGIDIFNDPRYTSGTGFVLKR
jgi:hypothetical protein